MMRALWTGASGMTAQQTNLDTISNNFANINTTGYKKETAQFKTLLYQKLQTKTTDANGDPKPVIGQVGLGVRTAAITSQYTQGNMIASENKWDMCISGDGFFMVQTSDGSTAYTRNGAFGLAISGEGVTLANADGYRLLDTSGTPIVFDAAWDPADVTIDEYGNLMYPDENNVARATGIQIGLAQFNNPGGLEKIGDSLLAQSPASGIPRLESEDTALGKSKVNGYFLEGSNVNTADEIVNLIVAQRAYEVNSKIITAADEMLQQANNLR